jgi:hypothetical protein
VLHGAAALGGLALDVDLVSFLDDAHLGADAEGATDFNLLLDDVLARLLDLLLDLIGGLLFINWGLARDLEDLLLLLLASIENVHALDVDLGGIEPLGVAVLVVDGLEGVPERLELLIVESSK